jgi:hypothetical protein
MSQFDGNTNAVKYNAKLFPKTAGFLASRGATIAEISDALGVTARTFVQLAQPISSIATSAKTATARISPGIGIEWLATAA